MQPNPNVGILLVVTGRSSAETEGQNFPLSSLYLEYQHFTCDQQHVLVEQGFRSAGWEDFVLSKTP